MPNDSPRLYDLLLCETVLDREGKEKQLYHNVCTLFELRDKPGMSGTLPFALERGDRLLIKPRRSNG